MPDNLDFTSSAFKNAQAAAISRNKPNTYSNKRKKSKVGNFSGLKGLASLNPRRASFGRTTV
tara:strand:- start:158 stop:343 length:186 start_codon:yes stop_codon:yes gene_type:complete